MFQRHPADTSPSRSARARAWLLPLALPALAAAASAQLDLSIPATQVNQSMQSNTTTLVAGKSTYVRMAILATGTVPPGTQVDGLMHVLVNGVEQSYSPVYSDNGPVTPSLAPNPGNEDDSLNFIFLPPQSGNVTLVLELNPAGPTQVAETNFANNSVTVGPLSFACRRVQEIVYVPIDYRPSGGSVPNLPPANFIEPGVGDNFTMGIYPGKDINYHRSVAPSKLWTSSLEPSGSSLVSALQADMQLMNPVPDWIYGWVPGGLSYNGVSTIGGPAAIGNTELQRFQRTFAHELGHNHGLQHNSTLLNTPGVDVERQLNLPLGLPIIKPSSMNDVMVAGLFTPQAWVALPSYEFFLVHPKYVCSGADAADAGPQPALMISGLIDRATKAVEVDEALEFVGGRFTELVPTSEASLVLRAYAHGALLAEFPIAIHPTADSCSGQDSATEAAPIDTFVAVLPALPQGKAIEQLSIVDAKSGVVLQQLTRSANAPVASFSAPAGGIALGGTIDIQWSAADVDGDALHSFLRYSPDGQRWTPLASKLAQNSWRVDTAGLPAPKANAQFELLVTDGLNTTSVRAHAYAAADGLVGNAPFVFMGSPDAGLSFPKGATVVLHGNGWDLEDQMMDGASLVWSSNVDGVLGTGRLTSTKSLSVGAHTITLTGTDSAGNPVSDTATITITDRVLPGTPPVVCQTDLGFGGPGSSQLAMCGGDLSTGTTANLELSGAAPNKLAWMAIGASNAPTALLGGTIVPVPAFAVLGGTTSGTGTWTFANVSGGGGPVSLYVQAIYLDPAQTQGFGISNALKVDLLP